MKLLELVIRIIMEIIVLVGVLELLCDPFHEWLGHVARMW